MDTSKDGSGKLESLDQSLYKEEGESKEHRHGVPSQKGASYNHDWADVTLGDTTDPLVTHGPRGSFFKKFFVTSLIFFIIAAGFGVFKILSNSQNISSNNVDLQIIGNAFVSGGEELKVTVQITNRNPVPLEVADLIVSYSKNNQSIAEDPSDASRERVSLGTIPQGKTITQVIPLTLFGREGSQKEIQFRLEYKIPESTALFDKGKNFVVTLSSSPLTVTTDGSLVAVSGQKYQFTIFVSANTKEPIENLFIKADYPPGFTFQDATPKPTSLDNGWLIPKITPGTPQKILVSGELKAQNGEERSFRIFTGTQNSKDLQSVGITYASMVHLVSVVRPFIETELIVNGERGSTIAIPPDNQVSVDIPWKNNLPFKVANVEISVSLEGTAINKESINVTNGYYDSSTNTITWNQNTLELLTELIPNQSGSVGFTFTIPKIDSSEKNQKIILRTRTKAVESGLSGGQPLVIDNINTTTIKLIGEFQSKTETLYATGPLENMGPIPPKVDTETTYTIHWMLYNGANPLTNVVARAVLPQYVRFNDVISPEASKGELVYNDKNREVTWTVKNLPEGTGVSTSVKEIFFSVTLKPSLSLVGMVPVLVKEGTVGGFDTFSGVNIAEPLRETTTDLTGDGNYSTEAKTVVQ